MATRGYSKYQKIIGLAGDLILLFLAFNLAFYWRQGSVFNFNNEQYLVIMLVYLFTWWAIISQNNLILLKRGVTVDRILFNLLKNTALHIVVVYLTMIVLRFYGVSRLMLFYAFLLEIGVLGLWRISYFKIVLRYRKAGFNYRNVVLVGTPKGVKGLLEKFEEQQGFGYKIKAILSTSARNDIQGVPNYPLANYAEVLNDGVDEVFCSLNSDVEEYVPQIIQYCEENVIRAKLFPDFRRYVKKQVQIDFFQDTPFLLLRTEPLESLAARTMKRAFDIFFSSIISLFVLSWLIPIIALVIRIESKGPIFFGQERTGKNNKNFKMLKFRSMAVNRDSDKKQATKRDVRITRVGAFLRKTSLDEMPQFLNVLAGQMSVVGPRPHMLQHTKEYSELINQYMVRHFVKPGITGWAQINGYRGATETPDLMAKRVEYDVWYIENWSFILDIVIIFRTVINAFKGEQNAY